MKLTLKTILFLILFLASNSMVSAQNDVKVGVSTTMEADWDNLVVHSYGIEVDKSFCKHWGIETGLNYKKYIYNFMNINYISIPVAARFYSRIVNVSLGTELNFYDNIELDEALQYSNSIVVDAFRLSFFTTISKEISLTPKVIIEPGLKFNIFNPISNTQENLGVSLKLKYRL